MAELFKIARGHMWTMAPLAEALVRPPKLTPWRQWETRVDDECVGPVRLTGALHARQDTDTLVIALHGLGGDIESHYILRAAIAANHAGMACLRLNMRGADHTGEDLYHAGLTADLRAAIASDALAKYDNIVLLGYSVGGHLVLRHTSEQHDPRVRAAMAVCAPLDLASATRDIDSALRWPYRRYVLKYLKRAVCAIARHRDVGISVAQVNAIRTMREWDDLLIAPRFGFDGADDYHQRACVAPHLSQLDVPTMIVGVPHDPMVLASSVAPALQMNASNVFVRWVERAGHVGFPADTDLGVGGPLGFEAQAITWLASNLR
jgi:predicted alpha/beta-fold hydrolase